MSMWEVGLKFLEMLLDMGMPWYEYSIAWSMMEMVAWEWRIELYKIMPKEGKMEVEGEEGEEDDDVA